MRKMQILGILAAAFFLCSSQALAFNCDDGKAEIGDSKYEISMKCGEPTHKDHTQISRVKKTPVTFEQEFIPVEQWLYNLGKDRLLTVVTFEKGKVIDMRTYGYGRSRGTDPDLNKKVEIGAPAVVVMFLFGPPTHKEERVDTSVVTFKGGATFPRMTHVEEWTYNLGPNRFMRIYHFENGRLKRIETGDRGF